MSEIADFLRARYAEGTKAVRTNWNRDGITSERYHGTPIDPTWLLADLDAKLALVDEHPDVNDGSCGTCVDGQWGYPTHGGNSPAAHPCRTLRILAQPFAGHADHKGEEWTP